MALLPKALNYEALIPRALSLLGYDDRKRAIMTDGILDAIRKVNDSDRRVRRIEALVLLMALNAGIKEADLYATVGASDAAEDRESQAEDARLATHFHKDGEA